MKREMAPTTRKHGLMAQKSGAKPGLALAWESAWKGAAAKPIVRLSFESRIQCYLWSTGRGRQRLIKH